MGGAVVWFVTVTLLVITTIWAAVVTALFVFAKRPPRKLDSTEDEINDLKQQLKAPQKQNIVYLCKSQEVPKELPQNTVVHPFQDKTTKDMILHALEHGKDKDLLWFCFDSAEISSTNLDILRGRLQYAPFASTVQTGKYQDVACYHHTLTDHTIEILEAVEKHPEGNFFASILSDENGILQIS